jgi:hypothetical protein
MTLFCSFMIVSPQTILEHEHTGVFKTFHWQVLYVIQCSFLILIG